jgi:hypothetical protein
MRGKVLSIVAGGIIVFDSTQIGGTTPKGGTSTPTGLCASEH